MSPGPIDDSSKNIKPSNIVRSAANHDELKSRPDIYKKTLTEMMKKEGVDINSFESVTSFLARGTVEQVLTKIRMFNIGFMKETLQGKHYQSPQEMFKSKLGNCNDYCGFNQYVLNKAHVSYSVFNIFKGGFIEAMKMEFGLPSNREGHFFLVARSGDRLYKVDNLAIFFIGDKNKVKNNEILNLMQFQIETLEPKNVWNKIEASDLNTKDDIYSAIGISQKDINNAGSRNWHQSARIDFEPGKPPAIYASKNDMGNIKEEAVDPDKLDLHGNMLLDMNEVTTRVLLGKVGYYLGSDNFPPSPFQKAQPTPYDKPY